MRKDTVEVPVAWFEGLLAHFDDYDKRRPSADALDHEGLKTDMMYANLKGYVESAKYIVERAEAGDA